jgi:cysteine-rich repeat protein
MEEPATTGSVTTGDDTSTSDTTTLPDSSSGEPGTTTGTTNEATATTDDTHGDTEDPGLCGNGVLDPGEPCDDGNADDTDLCLSDCHLGPADKGEVVPIPPLIDGEGLRCITAIDPLFLPGRAPELFLGSTGWHVLPDEYATRLQQLVIPAGVPVQWSWKAGAGEYGREVIEAATAANGDIIVAGFIWTELAKVDTGGYLWLARFAPDGAPVWNHEYEHEVYILPADMELTPTGDIVVVGNTASYASIPTARVHRFDEDGQQLWQFEEDKLEATLATGYDSVAVDADGAVYVAATRADVTRDGHGHRRMFLRALAPDGAPLWDLERTPPESFALYPGDIVLAGDQLVASAAHYQVVDDIHLTAQPELSLVAFDTAGNELWWEDWTVPAPWGAHGGTLVAAPDGGVFLAGGVSLGEERAQLLARFDADGANVWARLVPGSPPKDALLAPDDRLYVLSVDEVTSYAP